MLSVLLAVLILGGCSPKDEAVKPETEQTEIPSGVEKDEKNTAVTTAQKENDEEPFVMNGKWESEKRSDGAYLSFEIAYPYVINFDGNVSTISKAEKPEYDYVTYRKNGDGFLKIYFSDIEGDSAKVWYQDENGKFTNSLLLTRKAEEAIAGTSEKADDPTIAENKTETTGKPAEGGNTASSTSGNSSGSSENTGSGNSSESGSSATDKREENCHYETVNVLVKDAYDEQVIVKEGYWKTVREAWTETINDCAVYGQDSYEAYVCNGCGYTAPVSEWNRHDVTCQNSFHNDRIYYGDVHCLEYETQTIYHDAEREWVEPEYKYIHHDAEYRQEQKLVCE